MEVALSFGLPLAVALVLGVWFIRRARRDREVFRVEVRPSVVLSADARQMVESMARVSGQITEAMAALTPAMRVMAERLHAFGTAWVRSLAHEAREGNVVAARMLYDSYARAGCPYGRSAEGFDAWVEEWTK